MRISVALALLATGLVACGSDEVDAPIFDLAAEVPSANDNSNDAPPGNTNDNGNTTTNSNNANSNSNSANDNNNGNTNDTPLDPNLDTDSDGLPDVWEIAAGDVTLLDPMLADTDEIGRA
ncbi:MAG: hypothetical protein AAF658_22110, partial [Myxococcota bacterium]